MYSLEQIEKQNRINFPWKYYKACWNSRDDAEGLIRRMMADLETILIRERYKAQLAVFEHFGKTEKEYHKFLDEQNEKEK